MKQKIIICYHVESGHCFDIFASEFVGTKDGFLVPIGPIDPVLERGDWERMSKGFGWVKHDTSARSIVITWGNLI